MKIYVFPTLPSPQNNTQKRELVNNGRYLSIDTDIQLWHHYWKLCTGICVVCISSLWATELVLPPHFVICDKELVSRNIHYTLEGLFPVCTGQAEPKHVDLNLSGISHFSFCRNGIDIFSVIIVSLLNSFYYFYIILFECNMILTRLKE